MWYTITVIHYVIFSLLVIKGYVGCEIRNDLSIKCILQILQNTAMNSYRVLMDFNYDKEARRAVADQLKYWISEVERVGILDK